MIKSIIYLILGLFVLVGGFLELKRELSANKSKDKKKKNSEEEAKDELIKMMGSDNSGFFLLIGTALIIQLLIHFRNFEAMYFFEPFLTGMGIYSLFVILGKSNKKFLIYEIIIVIIVTLLLCFV